MNIKATILDFEQGSEPWKQHRARALNASELAVAMGISSNMQRNELVKCKATGIQFEHSDFVEQRVFAPGHAFEAMARPLAEELIGEPLSPTVLAATVDGLPLSASLDGQDFMADVTWEHKQASAELIASLERGIIPAQYHPQMEQGLLLSGATRCLFMASNGTRESMRFCWYESNPELRAKIIPTWKQFMADVAAYKPTAAEVKPTGKAPETLPALHIVINGGVSASNLDEFKKTALGAIRSVNRELTTDVHFADAEKAVKWCSDIEDRIKAAKEHALGQTASIDALFRTMDEISDEAHRVRLDLDKLVKARKEAMKGEIVASGVSALAKHISELNAAMPAPYMPTVPADFGGVIKGLRTIDSITNAVDTELARAKIAAAEMANRIHTNLAALRDAGVGVPPDLATLVIKAPDDFAAVIAQRKAAEQARLEAERERIRAEEAAKLQREAEAKAAAEKAEAERLERQRQAEQREKDRQAEIAAAALLVRQQDELSKQVETSHQGVAAIVAPVATPVMRPMADQDWPNASTGAVEKAFADAINTGTGGFKIVGMDFASKPEISTTTDDGSRLTLTQLNTAIAPVSIDVAGLSTLGFEPVEKVNASRLYRACDLPAICAAMGRHLESVAEGVAA